MNLKEIFKNKKLVIGITAIAVIFVVMILTLAISNLLSDKTPTSYDPGDSNMTDNNSLSFKNLGTVDIVPLVVDSTGVDLNSGFKIVCENKQPKSFFQKPFISHRNRIIRLIRFQIMNFILVLAIL